MATIRKHRGKWQALIRRKGCPELSRTFTKKADAASWARQLENEAETRGLPHNLKELDTLSLGDVIQRYRDTITVHKRGRQTEETRIRCVLRQKIAKTQLANLSPALFCTYRDQRLRYASPDTVRRELSTLQHVLKIARQEWGIPLPSNPVQDVRKPPAGRPRERRLEPGEFDALIKACKICRNPLIEPIVRIATETGMRRSEILNVLWIDVDLAARTLHIPLTKNGHPRTIPLTTRATELLSALKNDDARQSFPMTTNAFRCARKRVQSRSELVCLTSAPMGQFEVIA
ncbi:tyrosine-type recombinase/integrase [Magnetovibrio blakemorei]|uniref:Tyr recombinase domain-containing protein n=1 Tax=Magnetovibrio blakemorei TaxID=28181 RepID=A0A1E5Q5N2_9PROT|nr:site-specific integrase [Magnetovibrio blakemorei]OEJ65644.1 hypothetical protein BEN30_13885 [Magnetovibrio blakemorei]